jgi:hypothetical protein
MGIKIPLFDTWMGAPTVWIGHQIVYQAAGS